MAYNSFYTRSQPLAGPRQQGQEVETGTRGNSDKMEERLVARYAEVSGDARL